jgi:hypothetical protein
MRSRGKTTRIASCIILLSAASVHGLVVLQPQHRCAAVTAAGTAWRRGGAGVIGSRMALGSSAAGAVQEQEQEQQQPEPAMPFEEARASALTLATSKSAVAQLPEIVRALEHAYGQAPIATLGFHNMAQQGEWEVVHSTMYPRLAPAPLASSEELIIHGLR